MFISEIPGVASRTDDAEVVAQLSRCGGGSTGEPQVLGLMNESREVYRLLVCGSAGPGGDEAQEPRHTLGRLGFREQPSPPAIYGNALNAVFWKP